MQQNISLTYIWFYFLQIYLFSYIENAHKII